MPRHISNYVKFKLNKYSYLKIKIVCIFDDIKSTIINPAYKRYALNVRIQ